MRVKTAGPFRRPHCELAITQTVQRSKLHKINYKVYYILRK